ncbi:MAG: DNA polymerase III subunit alpha [Hyphomicrobiales bacterium]|nr:DNA polymerase III subunit alpha [Hyphomicrobiales bacterium]
MHLHTYTAYSLLESALRIERLAEFCRTHKSPALAVTDRGNMFGALEFSEALAKEGVQPIIGVTLPVHPDPSQDNAQTNLAFRLPHILLLAKDEQGYQNLMKVVSEIHLRPRALVNEDNRNSPSIHEPHAHLGMLENHAEGLICLTGGNEGLLEHFLIQGQDARAKEALIKLKEIFPERLYVELQRHNLEHEHQSEARQIALAYELELPLVATNAARFHERGDFPAYEVLCCIEQGIRIDQPNRRKSTEEHYLKPPGEMHKLFADIPEALDNSIEIARRCSYRPTPREAILPRFPDAEKSEAEELCSRAREGLRMRFESINLAGTKEEYEQRLEHELDVITKMNYPGYFLVVADFIQWARSKKIPVGPGRGSGAGSLVAYALTITDIDPLRFGLLFERFLNSERISMPDFDIDFCPDRRDDVIRYVCDKYGRDRVAQIITFGTLQARAVLRDVGRVLGVPYGQVDRLCKLVPYTPTNPTSLGQAIRETQQLADAREQDETVAHMMDVAIQLEGLYRHASTHAAGIVISNKPLNELVPLYRDSRSEMPVTQFSMKWVESAGLVKFDFLGLKTLSIIDLAATNVNAPRNMPLDDEKTFEMLRRGDTMGVFQVEGQGMSDTLRSMGADRIEDLIALIALYRPGPMDNIPIFIKCKQGKETPDYIHDTIRPVLEETYGVIVYQEQVMKIAQILADYSLNEADILRRAMGKKIRSEMEQQKQRFVEAVLSKDIDRKRAEHIFQLVNKFADYGFNKSHAAAYAMLVYQTAYLKAHYPAPFLAACMSWDMSNTDRIRDLRGEAEHINITLQAPCVNRSGEVFAIDDDGSILYALSAVRNIGRRAARHIAKVREEGGNFRDLFDFARRVSPRQMPKRAWEFLIKAGAFDALEPNRNRILQESDRLISISARELTEQEDAQDNLFGGGNSNATLQDAPLKDAPMWEDIERLRHEFEAIGFHLSGHPLDPYREDLANAGAMSLRTARESNRHSAILAGVVTGVKERKSSKGSRYAFVALSDPTSEFEGIIFSEALTQSRPLLEVGRLVVAHIEFQSGEDVGDTRVRISNIEALETFLARKPARRAQPAQPSPVPAAPPPIPSAPPSSQSLPILEIRVSDSLALPPLRQSLEAVRRENGAEDGEEVLVVLILRGAGKPEGDARLRLGGHFTLDKAAREHIESLAGIESVAAARTPHE